MAQRKRYREQTKCRFCRLKIDEVDYKDIQNLTKLTTTQNKLFSRKRSGNPGSRRTVRKILAMSWSRPVSGG